MLKKIANWLSGGGDVEIPTYGQLRKGRAKVTGFIHAVSSLESPIEQRPCVAFYYRASFSSTRAIRFSPSGTRHLRSAVVYADELFLDMPGGRLLLIPKERETFAAEEHEILLAKGISGFRAKEDCIEQGERVQVRGVLRQLEKSWQMLFDYLVVDKETVDKQTDESQAVEDI